MFAGVILVLRALFGLVYILVEKCKPKMKKGVDKSKYRLLNSKTYNSRCSLSTNTPMKYEETDCID